MSTERLAESGLDTERRSTSIRGWDGAVDEADTAVSEGVSKAEGADHDAKQLMNGSAGDTRYFFAAYMGADGTDNTAKHISLRRNAGVARFIRRVSRPDA